MEQLNKQDIKTLNRNIKIFPFFRALSCDILFVWTISTIYLTEYKGMSYSQALYLDSIVMLSAVAIQFPISKLIEKIGIYASNLIGGFCYLFFVVAYIFVPSLEFGNFYYYIFVLLQVVFAVGLCIKNVADTDVILSTLKALKKRNEYNYYEGKGNYYYHIFEAIASILAGYLFIIKPEIFKGMLPFIASAIALIVFIILSIFIKPVKDNNESYQLENIVIPKYKQKQSIKTFFSDKFIISIFILTFLFWGLMSQYMMLGKIFYQDSGVLPIEYIGYVVAISKIFGAFSCKYQFKFDLKFGIKNVIIFCVTAILTFAIYSLSYLLWGKSSLISFIIIIFIFFIQAALRAPFLIFLRNYITICTNPASQNKLLSIFSVAQTLGYGLIGLLFAFAQDHFNNNLGLVSLTLVICIGIPLIISSVFFIRQLIKKYAKKYTTIMAEEDYDN